MTDRTAQKARMRTLARAARRRVPGAERRAAAGVIATWAADIAALAGRGTVSCFSTFGDELDTQPLIMALARRGCRLALPVVVGRARPLVFRRWQPGDRMGTGHFGIREPLPSAPEAQPRVFLVPLLAFDRFGYRVGYGGGFYDRSLAMARAERRIAAIGLAFAIQQVGLVPRDRYDQPVDFVLTERGLTTCIGGARAAALSW